MNKIFIIILILLLPIFTGCRKSTSEKDKLQKTVSSETELNLERPGNSNAPQPSPQVQTQSVNNQYADYYFSGRTDFLSIRSFSLISAEDFEIGSLFENTTATDLELKLISVCNRFFDSLKINQPHYESIAELWRQEIKDYVEYFILGKIDFEKIVYGKPEMDSKSAIIKMRIYPDEILSYVYLIKDKENNWLISGLELDLRINSGTGSQEKWFPTNNPSPFGY